MPISTLLKQRSRSLDILKKFKTVVGKSGRCISSETIESLQEERKSTQTDDTATIYVHWPYCARRCSYCNFNKYVSKSVDHTRMSDCLVKETETLLELSGVTQVPSIFFGGGTPSLAQPATIGKVIETVTGHVTLTEGSEVTLEANPTHLETSKLRDFKHAGINRLSIGVQALNADDLKMLGRDHSIHEALNCVEEAMKMFSEHVSVDLMFGRPGQTVESWTEELKQIIAMGMNHISLYQLTVERGTQLFKWVESGEVAVPEEDTMADLYTQAVQVMHEHGLEQYEISNFAKKGLECKHNQAYWQGSQYIGIGPGAHGRFTPVRSAGVDQGVNMRQARVQTLAPDNWMKEVEKFGHGTRKIVDQSAKDWLGELLISGLRTKQGVTRETWSKIAESPVFSDMICSERCQQFVNDNLLCTEESRLWATSDGLLILDTILPHLLHTLNQICEQHGIT